MRSNVVAPMLTWEPGMVYDVVIEIQIKMWVAFISHNSGMLHNMSIPTTSNFQLE